MNQRRLADRLTERGLAYTASEPMAGHTTFQIGGCADFYLVLSDEAQAAALLRLCRAEGVPLLLIGRGSNLLVSDEGVEGVVARLAGRLTEMRRLPGDRIFCGAGAGLSALCGFALSEGLSGLEFAYGIPGTVGGAVYMNAGAYGGEMADVVCETRHLTADGASGGYGRGEFAFGYRRSRYQETGEWITGVTVQLTPGDPEKIRAAMQDLLGRRREKQPLEWPSAGSVFRRPPGQYAGTLIEACGLKGRRVGGAEVSEKHAGFIINRGGATCADVTDLIEEIRQTVRRETGVELTPEILRAGRIRKG